MPTDIQLNREAPGPLFQKLKDEIIRQIRLGTLRPGDRLPPTRTMARDLGLNRGTVSSAYEELLDDGVLTSHVGRGTFVSSELPMTAILPRGEGNRAFRWNDHFAGFQPAPPNAAVQAAASMAVETNVISFAGNVPDPELFPTEAFRKALNDVLKHDGSPLLGYGPPQGNPDFLAFLRDYLGTQRQLAVREEELMVVNGSQHGTDLIARTFLRSGDTVLVEEPTYYGAAQLFRGYGARLIAVPMDAGGVRLEAVEAVLDRERPKLMYVMPTFQNPTGGCLSAARRKALVQLTRRYHVPLVEDDFDGELYFDQPPPPPLKSERDADGVIYLGTPSKMLFPGLRIGWIVAPEPVIERLVRIKQMTDLSGSQLLQAALARFARTGGLSDHMQTVRQAYGQRVDKIVRALEKHMPDGVTWTRPQGGLSLLISLPEGLDTSELLPVAAAAGVLYTPGKLFYVEGGARHLRLSFGSVPTRHVEEGVRRLAGVVETALGSRPTRRRPTRLSLPPV